MWWEIAYDLDWNPHLALCTWLNGLLLVTRLGRTIRLALKSLMLHKLRSGLTMLGIVFGVFSVIAMLAIGEGASKQAQDQVLELGATNIIVRTVKPPEESSASGGSRQRVLTYGLLRADFRTLSELEGIRKVIPIREMLQDSRSGAAAQPVRLVGCTPEYLEINNLELTANSRFITDRDRELKNPVAVLSANVAANLFPLTDPIGQKITVGQTIYDIVGVMKHREATAAVGGSLAGQDFGKDVYIPIETLWARLTDRIVRVTSGSFSAEQVELSQITLQVADQDRVIPLAEAVRESLERRHGDSQDYSVVVPLELLKQADQIRQIFNIVLGSIAAISLVVGGIGIMNIMLATVTERTREIGVRRALGAKQGDITTQFLTETMVLAGTGGLIGVVMGLLTPFAWTALRYFVTNFVLESSGENVSDVGRMFTDMEPQIAVWSLPVAFGISVGIGVIFGLYPARSAARLDPIEALRHE